MFRLKRLYNTRKSNKVNDHDDDNFTVIPKSARQSRRRQQQQSQQKKQLPKRKYFSYDDIVNEAVDDGGSTDILCENSDGKELQRQLFDIDCLLNEQYNILTPMPPCISTYVDTMEENGYRRMDDNNSNNNTNNNNNNINVDSKCIEVTTAIDDDDDDYNDNLKDISEFLNIITDTTKDDGTNIDNVNKLNVDLHCYENLPTEYQLDLQDLILMPKYPMLAKPINFTTFKSPDEYIYEEKYDGERLLAVVFDNNSKKCYTRTLRECTILQSPIILANGYHNCIFDGELVYTNEFGKIIPICDTGNRSMLQVRYQIFDIQYFNGFSCIHKPLIERKRLLRECLIETYNVKITKHYDCLNNEQILDVFNAMVDDGAEGLILKNKSEWYMSNRRQWLKVKALHMREFKEEYDLYAYRFLRDKNGIYNILECGYYLDAECKHFVHVTNVSSGINAEIRNTLKLMMDTDGRLTRHDGLLNKQVIVTIIADKITIHKSLRHPSLYRIRNDLNSINIDKFL